MKFFLLLFLLLNFSTLSAYDDKVLKQMIARMVVIGFDETRVDENSSIIKEIQKYNLGGVILFDRFYKDRTKTKNIASPKQLKKLTSTLQSFANKPLLIALDQEGGKVARLKPKYGFLEIPSAKSMSYLDPKDAKNIYALQAKMLKDNGINCDFAPVVDLEVNPKNTVIAGLKRSYGATPQKVLKYAEIFIDTLEDEGVIPVLKHFPGHGSSLGDSHKGFVDVSDTWSTQELEPYKKLIAHNKVQMIMTAHVFNAKIDPKYPATLSYKTNTKLLREQMGYTGVIISDDMQMQAISKHYPLKEAVTLAINAGVDMLLFGNQLESQDTDELIDLILKQVKNGAISLKRIEESNRRIELLHLRPHIIQKPIDFTPNRIAMTKDYIQQHYGLKVKDIHIIPKIIVLHWTAVMDFERCYERLKGEKLFSDRGDISGAGALNVSSHFLVKRDGSIYQLMPENFMARHVIGLNYSSIGIENIGGEGNTKEDLTPAQVQANIALVKYLAAKYPSITYLIGHHEYRSMENTPLWLEKDAGYRTEKADPGKKFMSDVRAGVKELELKSANE